MATNAVPSISSPRRWRGDRVLTTLLFLSFMFSIFLQPEVVEAASGCASSTPNSAAYTVTLCFSTPSDGGTLAGNVTVTPTITVTGSNPGVQRIVYSIRGQYLLTAFQSPYTFTLNSALFVDGAASLTFVALMRDGYTTVNPASINVTLNNGVTSPPVNTNTFTPSQGRPGSPFIVAAAGDGASGETNSLNVSNLLSSINPNLFLYLGDVYDNGSLTEFNNWYGSGTSYFSKFNAITDPTVGNHEYTGSSAAGYFFYWNNVPNYYSFNTAGWHFISLNANNSRVPAKIGSAQYNWLQADLAANTSPCVLVYYHEPLFNVGPEGSETGMSDAWNLFAQDKVTLVVNGHDHDYQRWTAMDGSGNPDPNGVTEIVVGTAGHGIQSFQTTDSRMLVGYDASNRQYGVLQLQLNSSSVNFEFVNTSSAVKDSGTITCQGSGSGPTPTPSVTNTPTSTNTPSPTATITNTPVNTPTPTNTPVNTPTPTNTPDNTLTPTNTPVNTPTPTNTPVNTPTPTNTPVNTPTPTNTPVNTPTPTNTPVNTPTPTNTPVSTPTPTNTPVNTPTPTPTPTSSGSITLNPAADSYVNSSSPTTNYGTSKTLYVDNSPIEHSYIRFNVTGLSGAPSKATLKIFANSTQSTGFDVYSVSDNTWTETGINYSNAPAFAGTKTGSSGAIKTSGQFYSVDVTSLVTGNGQVSFGLLTTSSTAINLSSRESGANAPQLVITP
ncbi:MAG: DNRLRE domain-containing protein [Anaerolineaceae bacterium]|nr:DNRLRE domain-containing protein [Anaerolineaceae bacterium]